MDKSETLAEELLKKCPPEVARYASQIYKGHNLDYKHSNYCLVCEPIYSKDRVCIPEIKRSIEVAYKNLGYKFVVRYVMDNITQKVRRSTKWKKVR